MPRMTEARRRHGRNHPVHSIRNINPRLRQADEYSKHHRSRHEAGDRCQASASDSSAGSLDDGGVFVFPVVYRPAFHYKGMLRQSRWTNHIEVEESICVVTFQD